MSRIKIVIDLSLGAPFQAWCSHRGVEVLVIDGSPRALQEHKVDKLGVLVGSMGAPDDKYVANLAHIEHDITAVCHYFDLALPMGLPDGRRAPYDPALLAFQHEGKEIRNPLQAAGPACVYWVSAETYGFYPFHTGGGCMALRKDLPNGNYLLLTTDDGGYIPDEPGDAEDAGMSLYSADGEPLADINLRDVPEPAVEEE